MNTHVLKSHLRNRLRCIPREIRAMPETPKSFCAMMSTDGCTYATNALRFATLDEAALYAADLASRWTAVKGWRTELRNEPVNRVWVDGRIGYLADLGHTS